MTWGSQAHRRGLYSWIRAKDLYRETIFRNLKQGRLVEVQVEFRAWGFKLYPFVQVPALQNDTDGSVSTADILTAFVDHRTVSVLIFLVLLLLWQLVIAPFSSASQLPIPRATRVNHYSHDRPQL